jgi:hypothetical protein
MQHAIVLALDGLSPSFLGPYGNTWLETPAFNKLADESMLAQQMFAESPDLELLYRSFWQGTHAAMPVDLPARSPSLPTSLAGKSIPATLISDDESVTGWAGEYGFDEVCRLPTLAATGPAGTIAGTQVAQVLATAIDWLANKLATSDHPQLLWIHAGALRHAWDAPQDLRRQLADEEDPDVPDLVEPPGLFSEEPWDPDTLLGWSQSYAGEILALDSCLHWFRSEMESHPGLADSMFITTAPRGFPLGIHGHVGNCCPALYSDLLQVPAFIRVPPGRGDHYREYNLLQSTDIFQVLCQWFGLDSEIPGRFSFLADEEDSSPADNYSYSLHAGSAAIRTPAWFCHFPAEGDIELFAKPDDAWEINEVATLRPDIVEAMTEFHATVQQAYGSDPSARPALPALLADHWH